MEHSGHKLYHELFTSSQITRKHMSEGGTEDS